MHGFYFERNSSIIDQGFLKIVLEKLYFTYKKIVNISNENQIFENQVKYFKRKKELKCEIKNY